jgi:hypothetical protein
MEQEAKQGSFTITISKAQERPEAATGVTVRTVRKMKSEGKSLVTTGQGNSSFLTPNKKINRKRNVTGLDEFDLCVVRTEYDFYKTEKQAPTTAALKKKLHELTGFNRSLPSLRSILKNMGFRWRTTKSNIKLLTEKNDVREKRISFLRDISSFRREGKYVIYMDETYILSSHTVGRWQFARATLSGVKRRKTDHDSCWGRKWFGGKCIVNVES